MTTRRGAHALYANHFDPCRSQYLQIVIAELIVGNNGMDGLGRHDQRQAAAPARPPVTVAAAPSCQGNPDALGISRITIRKDLDYLESKGLVQRTHGGALSPQESTLLDPSLQEK